MRYQLWITQLYFDNHYEAVTSKSFKNTDIPYALADYLGDVID